MRSGQRLARGVARHLRGRGFASIEEFVPERGLRVDVMALGPGGEFWVVECKSGRDDFLSDSKWEGYLRWCDRYFWAVGVDFPVEILPRESGVMIADAHGAEILRMPAAQRLAPARRRALMQRFAMDAARRLQALRDPVAGVFGVSS